MWVCRISWRGFIVRISRSWSLVTVIYCCGGWEVRISRSWSLGSCYLVNRKVCDFSLFIMEMELCDLEFIGVKYIWYNEQHELARIWKWLSRAICTTRWFDIFRHVVVRHFTWITSDHCPYLLNMEGGDFEGPKPFRFERIWIHMPYSYNIIRESWGKTGVWLSHPYSYY